MFTRIFLGTAIVLVSSLATAAPVCNEGQRLQPFSKTDRAQTYARRAWTKLLRAEMIKNTFWRGGDVSEILMVTDVIPSLALSAYTVEAARKESRDYAAWRAAVKNLARREAIAARPLAGTGLEINSTLIKQSPIHVLSRVAEARRLHPPGGARFARLTARGVKLSLLTGVTVLGVTTLGRTVWQIAMKKENFERRFEALNQRLAALDLALDRNGVCR